MTRTHQLIVSALLMVASIGHAVAQDIRVKDAWMRATVPGQKVAGAYLTVVSARQGELKGVSSPLAASAEIHSMSMRDGVMEMRKLESLPLPANRPVALEPGGYHVMLFGLKKPLSVGDKVPLTFEVDVRGRGPVSVQTVAVVQEVGARGMKSGPSSRAPAANDHSGHDHAHHGH